MFFFQVPYLPELLAKKTGKLAMRGSSRKRAFSEDDLERYQEAWDRPGAMTTMINWYRAPARYGISGSTKDPTVRVPTLMIWGEDDSFLDERMADRSIELCREGELVKLPGITHWVQHEAAEKVSQLLIGHFVGS